MSNASGTGSNNPASRLTPRPPTTREDADSSHGGSGEAVRDAEQARQCDSGSAAASAREQMAESDENPQPLDPALIAGGEDLVGVANDMTTGPDTMGAPNVRKGPSADLADRCHTPRDDSASDD